MIGLSARERAPRLDIAVRYLKSDTANYLTQGVVRVDGDPNAHRSHLDAIGVYFGVAVGR